MGRIEAGSEDGRVARMFTGASIELMMGQGPPYAERGASPSIGRALAYRSYTLASVFPQTSIGRAMGRDPMRSEANRGS